MFRAFVSKLQAVRLLSLRQSKFSTRELKKPFTPEELQEYRRIFRRLPTNDLKTQSISTGDYDQLCKEMGYERTTKQIEKYMNMGNKLGGRLDMGEFLRFLTTIHDPKLFVQEYFQSFDLDSDGFISKNEYDIVVETLAVHDPNVKLADFKQFVEEADTNKDGKVCMEEFQAWLRNYN